MGNRVALASRDAGEACYASHDDACHIAVQVGFSMSAFESAWENAKPPEVVLSDVMRKWDESLLAKPHP
jgi:hypothetical protein